MRTILLAMLALLPTAAFGGIIPILTVNNTTINYGTNQITINGSSFLVLQKKPKRWTLFPTDEISPMRPWTYSV